MLGSTSTDSTGGPVSAATDLPTAEPGLRRALRGVRDELRIWLRHRWTLATAARRLAPERMRRVHLGCGPKHKPGWLNLDLDAAADLRLDLREPLPLPDGCAEWVYSEHFLEHLAYPGEVARVLAECRRILAPGGRLSVGVPDSEWPLREYADGGEYYRVAKQAWHPEVCRTRLEHLNWHFRAGGQHLWAYDAETLAAVLADAGFVGIERRAYDPALDSADRQPGTLYMEARRDERCGASGRA